ncbi:unnamed protein product [[Candida] boidinii]|nr:unnamed protein product [[Candida] boidinii]
MIVVSSDDYNKLKENYSKTSNDLDELKSQLELSQASLDSKQKEISDKSKQVEELTEQLNKLDDEHKTPNVDYIHEKANVHGMVVVPSADHHSLKTDLESASNELSELKKKLEATESSLVTKQKEIAAKHLEAEDLTKQLTAKTTEFTALHGKYQNPDVEYLHQKATNHKMIVVPTADHHAMKTDLLTTNTELEELSRKLKLSESSLEAKQKEISEKEKEILGLSGKLSLKTEEFGKLHEKYQTPDIDYINQKAINHNMVVIPYSEHATLKSSVTNLNDESKRLQQQLILEEKETERLKNKLVTKSEEIIGLQQQLENPSVEFVRQKAVSHGYIIMSSHDHSELQKKLVAAETEINNKSDDLENKRNEAAILKETVNQKNVQLKVFQKRLDKPEL